MEKPFVQLYTGLEKALDTLDHSLTGIDRYARGIELIRGTITQVGPLGRKMMRGRETEVAYFRQVWPVFYGKLLLYIRLYHFELYRLSLPGGALPAMIRREEKRIDAFFRSNREFWMYYRSGSPVLDEEFTRKHSQSRIFDPLALVIDQEGATLGSYRAAWCLAMEAYRAWMVEDQDRRKAPVSLTGLEGYTSGPADVDFVEWIYKLNAVEAVLYKGVPADISRLQRWAKAALGKEVANIYDRFKVLRNRKKDRMAFTKREAIALEKKMDEKEGKF